MRRRRAAQRRGRILNTVNADGNIANVGRWNLRNPMLISRVARKSRREFLDLAKRFYQRHKPSQIAQSLANQICRPILGIIAFMHVSMKMPLGEGGR